MQIKQLIVKNFRCFGENESVIDLDKLTAFIGMNSSGKTAVLLALEKLFGSNASKRELKRADFHVPKGVLPEALSEQSLYIEAIIDFPELDDTEKDGMEKITVPDFMRHMTVDEPGATPYVRFRLEGNWRKGRFLEGEIDQKYWFVTIPKTEQVQDISQYFKPVEAQHRSLIEIEYVPAIRNPAIQLRNVSSAILGRVWRGINWPEDIGGKIQESGESLDSALQAVSGFSLMQSTLNTQWSNLHSDIRYNRISLTPDSTDLDAILGKLDVRFFPAEIPGSYPVDALGEGLQSLFYLSLVNSLLEIEEKASEEGSQTRAKDDNEQTPPRIFRAEFEPPLLTILAIEEPENHIAPHLLGRVMSRLHKIAAQSNAQVIISSHSPAIVQRVEPESLRYLRICKDKLCTIVCSLTLPSEKDEAYKFVKEAVRAYPEVYFARLVVLGEGDTEEIVIPRVLRLLKHSLDESGISVVPLGGRFVNHFWRMLNELNIPFVTILDLDLGRETGGWERIKYVTNQLGQNEVDKASLFKKLSISSDEELERMHTRAIDREAIAGKVRALEDYDVYFAAPLDMDLMMFSAFQNEYKSTAPENGGPRIPNKVQKADDFQEKLNTAIAATLKSKNADSSVYTDSEKEMMIWYTYLFLNRGKPSTHILAFSNIDVDSEDFRSRMPAVLVRLLDRVAEILQDDPFSQLLAEGAEV